MGFCSVLVVCLDDGWVVDYPGGRSVSIGDAAIKCARCGMTYLEFDALLPAKQLPND